MNLEGIGWQSMDWAHVVYISVQWQAVMNTRRIMC
jgi:hypothetical protein